MMRACLILCFVFSSVLSFGQKAVATLDSSEIQIGRQINLHLELTHPKGKKFTWPSLPDSIQKIEVLNRSLRDTIASADGKELTIRQSILITCFDSGYYAIPPFRFIDTSNPDSLNNFVETSPLLLSVFTVEVDTTASIKDIKPVIEMPLTWRDFIPYAAGILGLALAAFAALYLYRKFRKKPAVTEKKIPSLPAHETALKALSLLEEKKLWQQGQVKAFYTELTDILRTYLDHRWQVNAMEMTSDEIMQYPVIYKLDDAVKNKLRYILTIADLVKFAKMITVPHENEQCMKNAYDFVHETAIKTLSDETAERKEEVAV
jgi:hypothetical protein